MSVTNKLTGKAQAFTFKGTTIPVTKVGLKTTRTLADATDSADYDSGTDMLWETQIPVKLGQEFSVEGKYNTSTIPSALLADLYSGNAAGAVTWTLKSGVVSGHGNFDLSDFETSAPVDDVVSYTLTAKLSGVWTSGS